MISSTIITALFALSMHSSLANPLPDPQGTGPGTIPQCQGVKYSYETKESRVRDGDPIQIATSCIPNKEEGGMFAPPSVFLSQLTLPKPAK